MSYRQSNKPPVSSLLQESGFDSSSLTQRERSHTLFPGGGQGTYDNKPTAMALTDDLHSGGLASMTQREAQRYECCDYSFPTFEGWELHQETAHGQMSSSATRYTSNHYELLDKIQSDDDDEGPKSVSAQEPPTAEDVWTPQSLKECRALVADKRKQFSNLLQLNSIDKRRRAPGFQREIKIARSKVWAATSAWERHRPMILGKVQIKPSDARTSKELVGMQQELTDIYINVPDGGFIAYHEWRTKDSPEFCTAVMEDIRQRGALRLLQQETYDTGWPDKVLKDDLNAAILKIMSVERAWEKHRPSEQQAVREKFDAMIEDTFTELKALWRKLPTDLQG